MPLGITLSYFYSFYRDILTFFLKHGVAWAWRFSNLDATRRYSTLLDATWRYSTADATRRYSTLLNATRRYSTLLNATRRCLTLLDAARRCSTLLDATRRYSTLLDATWCYLMLLGNFWGDLAGRIGRQTWPADLAGRLGRQTWLADLAGRLGRQSKSREQTYIVLRGVGEERKALTLHVNLPLLKSFLDDFPTPFTSSKCPF
jgi:hypothetical protein